MRTIILIIFTVILAGTVRAQECHPDCPEPIVFNFACPNSEDIIIFSTWEGTPNNIPEAIISQGDLISEITEGTSSDEFLTVTTIYEQFSTVATYTYEETRTYTVSQVDDLDDPAPTVDASELKRTVTVSETITQISNEVIVTNPSNPNWIDPVVAANEIRAIRQAAIEALTSDCRSISGHVWDGDVESYRVTIDGVQNVFAGGTAVAQPWNPTGAVVAGVEGILTEQTDFEFQVFLRAIQDTLNDCPVTYESEVDKIPAAPDVSTRQDREDALTDLSPLVDIYYSNLVDVYLNELSTNYHIITIGEYVWDGSEPEWALQDLSPQNWYFVWYFANDSLLKIKYGI